MRLSIQKCLVAATVLLATASINNTQAAEIKVEDNNLISVLHESQELEHRFGLRLWVSVELNAEYVENDIIRFAFNDKSLDPDTVQTTFSRDDGAGNSITFSEISREETDQGYEFTHRVTHTTGSTVGLLVRLQTDTEWKFQAEQVTSGGTRLSFESETRNGTPLEGSDGSVTKILTWPHRVVQPYFLAPAHLWDAPERRAIDWEGGRTGLVDSSLIEIYMQRTAHTTRLLKEPPRPSTINTPLCYFTPANGTWLGLEGDLSFAFDEEGDHISDALQVTRTSGRPFSEPPEFIDESRVQFLLAFQPPATVAAITLDPNAFEGQLTDRTLYIFADVGLRDCNNTSVAGTFTLKTPVYEFFLSSATVNVSYMPFGETISQILNVSNTSSEDAEVLAIVRDEEGTVTELGEIAVAKASSLTTLAGPLSEAMEEAGLEIDGDISRYSLQFELNAPDSAIGLYSAYNVDGTGARLVINDSNGGAGSK